MSPMLYIIIGMIVFVLSLGILIYLEEEGGFAPFGNFAFQPAASICLGCVWPLIIPIGLLILIFVGLSFGTRAVTRKLIKKLRERKQTRRVDGTIE